MTDYTKLVSIGDKFGMHILGDDCPYVCEKYERWAAERSET